MRSGSKNLNSGSYFFKRSFSALVLGLSSLIPLGLQALELPRPPAAPFYIFDKWQKPELDQQQAPAATENQTLLISDETTEPLRPMTYLPLPNIENPNYLSISQWMPMQLPYSFKAYSYLMNIHDPNGEYSFGKHLLRAAGLTIGYHYKVEPSLYKNYFTRSDRYYFKPELQVSKKLLNLGQDKLLGKFRAGYHVELSFYRQFKDPKNAILATPLFEESLPVNAQTTLHQLNPGDVFSFSSQMNLVGSAAFMEAFAVPGTTLIPSALYLVKGAFEVRITRLPHKKARLQVISARRRGGGVRFGDVLRAPLALTVGFIGEEFLQVLPIHVPTMEYKESTNQSVVFDYVLNLGEPEIATAFNKALAQMRNYNFAEIVDPRIKQEKLNLRMVSQLADIEALEIKYKKAGITNQVIRLQAGVNNSVVTEWGFNLENSLVNFGLNSRDSSNTLTPILPNQEGEHQEKYLYDQYQNSKEFGALFSLFNIKAENRAGAIYVLDDSLNQAASLGLFLDWQKEITSPFVINLDSFESRLKDLYPQFASRLVIDRSRVQKQSRINTVVARSQVAITAEAMNLIPAYSVAELTKRFVDYVKHYKIVLSLPNYVANASIRVPTLEDKIEGAGNDIARRLNKLLNRNLSIVERMDNLNALRYSSVFCKIGPGFIVSLIPADQSNRAQDVVKFTAQVVSTDGATLDFSAGNLESQSEVYMRFMLNESLTNDDGMDIRVQLDSLPLSERTSLQNHLIDQAY